MSYNVKGKYFNLDNKHTVPNMFATGSVDKSVKIWGVSNGSPKCLYSTNLTVGHVE